MIDATLLFGGVTVFSPWFPRQADMLRVTAECVAVNGAAVTIGLYTKNFDTTGDGNSVDGGATTITLSTTGRSTAEWKTVGGVNDGVRELLRFRYDLSGSDANEWILFRLLPAVWFDAVKT